ncbi:MAG: hypothetical protein LUH09_09375 [Clostridiales bacterium]|nr:hypothetical protein [Clostridiales bacterium]
MSAQTITEIRAKFTADLSDYRKKVQEAGRVSQSFQDEISRIQQNMRSTRSVTDTEMKKVSSALSAAGKRAEQLGRQTRSLPAVFSRQAAFCPRYCSCVCCNQRTAFDS